MQRNIKTWITWINYLGDGPTFEIALENTRKDIKEWASANNAKASLFKSEYFKSDYIIWKLRIEKEDGDIFWYNVEIHSRPVYRGDTRIRGKYKPYKRNDDYIFYYAYLERINWPKVHFDKMKKEILC